MGRRHPGMGDKHKDYLRQRESICRDSENSTSISVKSWGRGEC